jgi:isopenicillin-N N-acyltransferase-like protein
MAVADLRMPIIELQGTPREIGEAHGESLRPLIREHAERHLEWILSQSSVELDETRLSDLWAPYVAANESSAPELVDEMRGIARGADVPFEQIFYLNSLLDVGNLRWLDCMKGTVGCTSFALPVESGTGHALLGQTYDLAAFRRRFNVLMRIRPADEPQQLVYTLAGMVGAAGLNEAGIGININYLSSNDCRAGKLHAVIVRQALASRNLADAVTAATVGLRAGGSHYLISDDTGHVVSIETSATRFALDYADGKPFGHTNHYLSEWMQPIGVIRATAIGSSVARYAALRRFLLRDDLDREQLKQMTSSHTSYPRSICAHGSADEPEELRGATIAAMVQSLPERTMEICEGCPCEGKYVIVPLLG